MLLRPLTALATSWISRAARPDAAALAAVAGRQPCIAIAGGSEGIGLAIALQFARNSSHVLLIGRSEPKLAEACQMVAAVALPPAQVSTLALDVTDPDAAAVIDKTCAQSMLYLDCLVLSAGIGLSGPFDAHATSEIDALLAINVAAATRLIHHVLPGMLARGRGGVLALASLGGATPGPYQATYYASKAYLASLIEAVAQENRGRGVRLSVVLPGPVETRFHEKMSAETALYRRVMPSMSASRVAASAVRGYRLGHTVIRPGFLTRVLAIAMRLTPHPLLVPVVGWLLRPRPP